MFNISWLLYHRGRILNRFTYDTEVVGTSRARFPLLCLNSRLTTIIFKFSDILLTEAMSIFMISISWFVAGILVMSTILPWVLCVLVPVTCLYAGLLYYYRMTGIDMQRLDAKARSPIQALVSEGKSPLSDPMG